MILIELNGEQQLVESLDGYDGCTVIEKDVEPPPSDYCARVDGVWVEDQAEKEVGNRDAGLAAMSRADLMAVIDAKIDAAVVAVAAPRAGA